jgi:hypothetical protein
MAQVKDLTGLGMTPALANRIGRTPAIATSSGAARGSATSIGGDQHLTVVTGSNSGGGMCLPSVGGDNGACLGDEFVINNMIAPITLYAPAGCSIYGGSANTVASGSGGVAIASISTAVFYPVSATTWVGVIGA